MIILELFTDEKHYNTLNNYYRNKYGKKVFKIALNGNFTCPNIDGTVGKGGCTFCSAMGSGEFAGSKKDSLEVQFDKITTLMENKWNDGYYIAYFQANTNTHGPLDKLKYLFEKAISLSDNIVMLSIATRPDSLPIEVLDYLAELNKKVKVQVELGLQTIHEETSILINRCHDLITFDHAVKALRKRDIEVVVHIINGLPGESSEMMLDTVKHLNTLDIKGIKIHMLHIIKKTKMGFDYQKNPWPLLSLNEYRDIVTDQLRHLRKDIIVHRITGDAKKEDLIAPLWTLKKFVVSNEIDKYMRANLYYQGDLYESQSN